MRTEEIKVEKNTGYIAPVGVDSTVAHVEDTKRRAQAEQQIAEKDGAASADQNGNAEGNVLIDGILELAGIKSAANIIQLVDERITDRAGANDPSGDSLGGLIGGITQTIDDSIVGQTSRKPGTYEGIYERAQIATASLDLDPKHVNTDVWNGTDTKLNAVLQTRDMSFRKAIEHELMPQIRGVEMQHQAMMGQARMMAPGLSMDGPSINPQSLLREAEQISQEDDWIKRMRESGG